MWHFVDILILIVLRNNFIFSFSSRTIFDRVEYRESYIFFPTNLEKLHMQKERFLHFPRYYPSVQSELVGQSSVPIRKPVTLLSMSTAIFSIFPFFLFFFPFTTISASSPSYLLSLSFPSFLFHGIRRRGSKLKRTIASKRVFVRHSNSSANIYIYNIQYIYIILSFSRRSFNESTSLSRDHIVRELSSTNRGKSEEGGACSFVRLFSNYRGE